MEYNLEITQKNISAIEFIQNVITPTKCNLEITQKNTSYIEFIQKNTASIEFIQKVIAPIELNRANITLVKANNYDYYRGITDSSGNIIESPEEYKLRVPKEYRYIGLEVVLRTNPDDTTYTKYAFINGIEDYDFEPIDYFLGIESYIEDSFISTATNKALSANKGRELYNLIININGGTY